MSYLEEVARHAYGLQRARKGDVAGFGPVQIRASGNGWFYKDSRYSNGRFTETCFFDEKNGDLETEMLKQSIQRTKQTIKGALSELGADMNAVEERFKQRVIAENTSDLAL